MEGIQSKIFPFFCSVTRRLRICLKAFVFRILEKGVIRIFCAPSSSWTEFGHAPFHTLAQIQHMEFCNHGRIGRHEMQSSQLDRVDDESRILGFGGSEK